jgi:hypothetical protein
MLNFVAVGPAGAGDIRVWPFGGVAPTASVLNYATVTGLNIANGVVVPICDPAVATCTDDLVIQADVSATHLVVDVLGYFAAPEVTAVDNNALFNEETIAATSNFTVFSPPCPAGWRVTGGGHVSGAFDRPVVIGSRAAAGTSVGLVNGINLADRWLCQGNNAGAAMLFRCTVVCSRVPGR